MDEQARLAELSIYRVMHTPPEKELDELTEIASAICDTPISILSFIDDKDQWLKATKGLSAGLTPRETSFCQHALHEPDEVLVVNDSLKDARFKNNPFVTGSPNIRFYAGAPLVTPNGHVLGTLCVIDDKPREISENKKKALQILANKAMDFLETRKLLFDQHSLIAQSAAKLKNLTDCAPGVIFQLQMYPDGRTHFPFISKGFSDMFKDLSVEAVENTVEAFQQVIYPNDWPAFQESLEDSYQNLRDWTAEYRIEDQPGNFCWHWVNARPEIQVDHSVVWYGTFQDVTQQKEYTATLEQILFDISHTLRKPVASILGLVELMNEDDQQRIHLNTFLHHLGKATHEIDDNLKKLNMNYAAIKAQVKRNRY